MDKIQLQQKIAEYFEKLPKGSQDVFSSMSWMETLKNIGVKFNLNEDQMEVLGTETTLLLLCIISLDEYTKVVETNLKLTPEITTKILNEINKDIIEIVRVELEETFKANNLQLAENSLNEEVPVPPYAKEEEKIETPKVIEPVQPKKIDVEEFKLPEEKKDENKNIIEDKLKSSTVSNHDISDYSKPKTETPTQPLSTPTSSPRSFDPYREAF